MKIPTRALRQGAIAALVSALIFGSATAGALPAAAAPSDCATVDQAVQVTPDCTDATYVNPVIDSQSDETLPVPHHRVRGHFEGTSIEFNIYLHPADAKSDWEGRFFQSTYPIAFPGEENTAETTDRDLIFALNNGGYSVRAGNGTVSIGYRHTAAAAKFARTYAAQYYGSNEPISGYLYGASGGSMQVIGAAENTEGVWQGFVPQVQAVQQPTSYNFLGRAAAALILSDSAEEIRAALLPGGSGDPYATLDDAERSMLSEVHALGIPWEGWEYPDYLLGRDTQFYANGISSDAPLSYDPTYVDDFWNSPGYLGAEQSPLGDRVRSKLLEMGDTTANRWNIANRFYYRYQIPAASEGWVGLDQFRKADGSPLYPQRPVTAPISTAASGNAKFDGSITGKVIAITNLYDTDALPLHTDFYRERVEKSLGAAAVDSYRVYFNDHADHQGVPTPGDERSKHLVDWYGSSEQALRDVAAWAEDGVAPPASTEYELVDGQIVVPDDANARRGIQPIVDLEAEGSPSATITVGETVDLSAVVEAPSGTGSIIKTEWDLDGDGTFEDSPLETVAPRVTARTTHAFDTPGTYLVALRVTSERNADVNAVSARVQNLDRVQVVVLPAPCTQDCGAVIPGLPVVTGEAEVGTTLTAEPGDWQPSDVELAYQWLADGDPIEGATSKTFALTSAQTGARVSVTVTGTRTGYTSASATSTVTATVVADGEVESPSAPNTGGGEATGGSTAGPDGLAATGAELPLALATIATLLLTVGAILATRVHRRHKQV